MLKVTDRKVEVVPLKVIIDPDVSTASRVVAAEFWIWKAVVESAIGLTSTVAPTNEMFPEPSIFSLCIPLVFIVNGLMASEVKILVM